MNINFNASDGADNFHYFIERFLCLGELATLHFKELLKFALRFEYGGGAVFKCLEFSLVILHISLNLLNFGLIGFDSLGETSGRPFVRLGLGALLGDGVRRCSDAGGEILD